MKPAPARSSTPGWVMVLAALVLIAAASFTLITLLDNEPDPGDSANPRRDEAVSEYGEPEVVGRLQVPELTELSGLAASHANPGLLWAHNDSGDGPFLYCLRASGTGCGTWRVTGAQAVDWEDIAAAPDDTGDPALYIGDIGDNARSRTTVTVYRVVEPHVADPTSGSSAASTGTQTSEAETFKLTYPGRAHDAEAIVVNRATGDLYVITKDASRSTVFVARAPLSERAELERVTSMKNTGLFGSRTGASLSPTGDRIVFSTYASGYELQLPDGRHFDAIWSQEAVPIDLGRHAQGEAVTYTTSGQTIISASEGARSPIYAVDRRR